MTVRKVVVKVTELTEVNVPVLVSVSVEVGMNDVRVVVVKEKKT